jgi:regulator of protease activity HflC (stomatin/prohibitin superfamily)
MILPAIGAALIVLALVILRRFRLLVIAVGAVLILSAMFTQVPAQSVGVPTSFGKVTGKAYKPGLHVKAPWKQVHDMDGTIQQMNMLGASNDTEHADDPARWRGRTTVRLNTTNSLMYVDNALRWKIVTDAAPQLYQDWRKGSGKVVENHVADGLVAQELTSAVAVALGSFDPLTPGAKGQTTDDLEKKVVDRLNARIGDKAPGGPKIIVESYNLLPPNFDGETQARIALVQQQQAETRRALERQATVAAEKLANKDLAESVKDPGVLVSKCLDNQAHAIEKGLDMRGYPPCIPGVAGAQPVTPTS